MLTKRKVLLVYVYCSTLFRENVNTIMTVKKRNTNLNKATFYTKVIHHLTFSETDIDLKRV